MTLKNIGLSVLAGLVGAVIFVALPGGPTLGGVYSQSNQNFSQGLKVGTSEQFVVSSAGAVTASGDITTTGQIASDKATFCMNIYSTSTATRGKLMASSTATIEGVDGVLLFSYGACS